MTTVGFGDIVPNTPGAKSFVIAYIFVSIGFISFVLSQAADYLLRAQMVTITDTLEEDQLRKRQLIENAIAHHIRVGGANVNIEQGTPRPAPHPARWAHEKELDDQLLHRGQLSGAALARLGLLQRVMLEHPRMFRAARAILLLAIVVMAGACFFRWGTQSDSPSDWMDCIYFAVVMCTTVGYGDFEALYLRDRLFTAIYVLFGTIITGTNMADSGCICDNYLRAFAPCNEMMPCRICHFCRGGGESQPGG